MLKRIIVILQILVIIGLAVVSGGFYLKNAELKEQLAGAAEGYRQLQDKFRQEKEEKAKVLARNEELEADARGYTQITKTQQEQIDKFKAAAEEKDKDIAALKEKLDQLIQQNTTQNTTKEEVPPDDQSAQEALSRENKQLKGEIEALKVVLKREQGLYYYNLGVAYVQAKLFNNAVEAYNKSLSFDADNPEAHYNLGLLYENFLLEPEKAILHYQKYLELAPEAQDKEEVQVWVDKLGGAVYQKMLTDTSKKTLGEKKVEVNLVR